jgi:hypothetical protein
VDDAFDTFRNQRVRASESAAAAFPGRYICPVCQTEVLHASGLFVSPYFRHHPGRDHEECERYCRTFYRDIPLARHEAEHVDAALVARLKVDRDRVIVDFAVRYRAHGGVESVVFIAGANHTPYKIHRALRQQFFSIRQPEEHYLVKARLAGGSEEPHIIDGFSSGAAVFAASEKESVRLAPHRVLQPGNYIVVTRTRVIDRFLPSLGPIAIDTITGLHAVKIEIPEDPNWQVRDNLRTLLGFETTATLARYAFLAPEFLSEVGTDSWEIALEDRIACYVRLSKHLPTPRRLLVQQRHRGQLLVQYYVLSDDSLEFVLEITPTDGIDLYRVGIDTDTPRFLFDIRRESEGIKPAAARLLFHFTRSDRNYRLLWSSHQLMKLLRLVKRGECKLESIKLPNAAKISIADSSGAREQVSGQDAATRLTELLVRSRPPINVQVTGYPDLTLWRETARVAQMSSMSNAHNFHVRSKSDARLAAAFQRRRTSGYSVRMLK